MALASHPRTRVTMVLGIMIPMFLVMLLFLGARLFVKGRIIGRFSADDWAICFAALCSLALTTVGAVSTDYGTGYLLQDIKPEWIVSANKFLYVGIVLYGTSVTLPKISLCLTYIKTLPLRADRLFCQLALTYLTLWLISNIIVSLLACRPIQASWNPTIPNAVCVHLRLFHVISGALNNLSDFFVYLWPMRILWHVRLPTKQRFGLIAVLIGGWIVCAISVVQTWYLSQVLKSSEVKYDSAIAWAIAGIQVNLGIVCACLHTVRPLLSIWWPHIFGRLGEAEGTSISVSSSRKCASIDTVDPEAAAAAATLEPIFPTQTLTKEGVVHPGRHCSIAIAFDGKVLDVLEFDSASVCVEQHVEEQQQKKEEEQTEYPEKTDQLESLQKKPNKRGSEMSDPYSPRCKAWAIGGEGIQHHPHHPPPSIPPHGISRTQHFVVESIFIPITEQEDNGGEVKEEEQDEEEEPSVEDDAARTPSNTSTNDSESERWMIL